MTFAKLRAILAGRLHRLAYRLVPPAAPPAPYGSWQDYQRESRAQDAAQAQKAREIAYLARLDTLEQREIKCRDDEGAIERARQDIAREQKALKAGFTKLKNARVLLNRDRARIRIMDAEIAKEIERLRVAAIPARTD